MRVSIFGMGYVGAVCAGCLADAGHDVLGVDVSILKVDLINRGRAPVVEPGLDELLARQIAEVDRALAKGAERAREVANVTIAEVKDIVGYWKA